MSHRRGATGSVAAPRTQSRTDGPERTQSAQIGVQGLETPWLDLQVLTVPYEPTWRTWYLWGNAQLIDDGIGDAVDFRRCPFGRAS